MNKILIIGQAPPAVIQKLPYDTTMLYEWFEEIGISKEQSQEKFVFDALTDKFPGYLPNGGHKKPSWEMFVEYWICSLRYKVESCKSIIVLGSVAKEYLSYMKIDKPLIFLIHPSKRNYHIYKNNKEYILQELRKII